MARKHHKPEEIVAKLRQVEVLVGQGKPVADAVRAIAVTEATYYRWRAEYGDLKLDQVKRLKVLEQENSRLRQAVADLTLEKLVLKEAAAGNLWSAPWLQGFRHFRTTTVCANLSSLLMMLCAASGHDGYPRPAGGAVADVVEMRGGVISGLFNEP